jgi:uncharacterized protein YjbJ (UPF0337 family)
VVVIKKHPPGTDVLRQGDFEMKTNMKTVESKIDSKRHAVVGTLNQAKGLAREKVGQVTNNRKMRLGGKKDQVIGTLQKNLGDSWAYRHKTLLATLTTTIAIIVAAIYYFNRISENSVTGSQYGAPYTQ